MGSINFDLPKSILIPPNIYPNMLNDKYALINGEGKKCRLCMLQLIGTVNNWYDSNGIKTKDQQN